jgi:hypothetical protein
MERPEYFVVRVYRRMPDDPTRIDGVVEAVAHGKQVPFSNAQELWAFLQHPSPAPDRSRSE